MVMVKFSNENPDSLIIYGSNNCQSPGIKLFSANTRSNYTVHDTACEYSPAPGHWKYFAVDLSAMKNSNKCIIDFKAISGPNHSFYIRNIRVYSSNSLNSQQHSDPILKS